MIVGVPKETKDNEFRVKVIPAPFVLTIADKGFAAALMEDPHLRDGLNIHEGKITHKAVAEALDHPYVPASEVLKR